MNESQFLAELAKLLEDVPNSLVGKQLELNGQWGVIIIRKSPQSRLMIARLKISLSDTKRI